MNAVLMLLVHVRTQLAQGLQMEINRTAANVASAERRNERFAQAVQQRTGEQDRNAGGSGKGIHIGHVSKLHLGGVDGHNALGTIHIHIHAMQTEQVGHHMYVTNLRHVLQHGFARSEQCGHHGLAHEVLRAAYLNGAVQRLAAYDVQNVVLVFRHVLPLSFPSNSKLETHYPSVCHTDCSKLVKSRVRRSVSPFCSVFRCCLQCHGPDSRSTWHRSRSSLHSHRPHDTPGSLRGEPRRPHPRW